MTTSESNLERVARKYAERSCDAAQPWGSRRNKVAGIYCHSAAAV